MKSYTDLEQSKKLAEILPLESADMYYGNFSPKGLGYENKFSAGLTSYIKEIKVYEELKESYKIKDYNGIVAWEVIPCWSLAALLDILPVDWWDYNKHYFLETSKMGDVSTPYIVSYFRFREQSDGANFDRITHISFQSDNPIDACYEMIIKLNEQKLL